MHRIICTCTHSTGLRIRPGLYLSSPSIHPYSTLNQISVAASALHSAPVTDHERWCRHRYNITTTLHIGCCGAVDVCTPLLLCSRIVAKVRLINFTFIFHSFIAIHPSLVVVLSFKLSSCLVSLPHTFSGLSADIHEIIPCPPKASSFHALLVYRRGSL